MHGLGRIASSRHVARGTNTAAPVRRPARPKYDIAHILRCLIIFVSPSLRFRTAREVLEPQSRCPQTLSAQRDDDLGLRHTRELDCYECCAADPGSGRSGSAVLHETCAEGQVDVGRLAHPARMGTRKYPSNRASLIEFHAIRECPVYVVVYSYGVGIVWQDLERRLTKDVSQGRLTADLDGLYHPPMFPVQMAIERLSLIDNSIWRRWRTPMSRSIKALTKWNAGSIRVRSCGTIGPWPGKTEHSLLLSSNILQSRSKIL